jgi:hypothetical protein
MEKKEICLTQKGEINTEVELIRVYRYCRICWYNSGRRWRMFGDDCCLRLYRKRRKFFLVQNSGIGGTPDHFFGQAGLIIRIYDHTPDKYIRR